MKKRILFVLTCMSIGLVACGTKRGTEAGAARSENASEVGTQQDDLQSFEKKYQAGTLDLPDYEIFAEKLAAAGRFDIARDVLERGQILSYSEERQQILDTMIVPLTGKNIENAGTAGAAVQAVYQMLRPETTENGGMGSDINDLTNIENVINLVSSESWTNELMQGLPVGRRNFEYQASDTSVLKLMYEITIYGAQNTKLSLVDNELGYIAISLTDTEALICRAEEPDGESLAGAFIYEKRVVTKPQQEEDEATTSETEEQVSEMTAVIHHQGEIKDGHFIGAYTCNKTGRTYLGEFDDEGRTKVEQKDEIKKENKVVYADLTEGTNYYYLALTQDVKFVFTPESVGIETINLW